MFGIGYERNAHLSKHSTAYGDHKVRLLFGMKRTFITALGVSFTPASVCHVHRDILLIPNQIVLFMYLHTHTPANEGTTQYL